MTVHTFEQALSCEQGWGDTISNGKHGGTLVCHLLEDLKIPGSNLDKDEKFIELEIIFEIHIVCVYLWLETMVSWVYQKFAANFCKFLAFLRYILKYLT